MGGLSRIWSSSCSQNRLQEPRGRHRLSTVIQPLRQNAGEVVDLTVDEDGKKKTLLILFLIKPPASSDTMICCYVKVLDIPLLYILMDA